jgi:hypothetical protein
MDTFEFKVNNDDDSSELTMKFSEWSASLPQILDKFAQFLKGAGFIVEGELQFVVDVDEDGFFTGAVLDEDDSQDDSEDAEDDDFWHKLDSDVNKT